MQCVYSNELYSVIAKLHPKPTSVSLLHVHHIPLQLASGPLQRASSRVLGGDFVQRRSVCLKHYCDAPICLSGGTLLPLSLCSTSLMTFIDSRRGTIPHPHGSAAAAISGGQQNCLSRGLAFKVALTFKFKRVQPIPRRLQFHSHPCTNICCCRHGTCQLASWRHVR